MRLIDADALKMWIDCGHLRPPMELCFSELDVVRMLDKQPTIDVEPVTRCNMCKYYEAEVGFCHYHDHGMHWDDFCSRCAKMDLEVQDGENSEERQAARNTEELL